MTPTLSLTEEQTLTAVRAFLINLTGDGTGRDIEVVTGQDNRVAPPQSANYIVMTSMLSGMLETSTETYYDGSFDMPPTPAVRMNLLPSDVTVQLDVHGPRSKDLATTIAGMVRTDYCVDALAASGFDVTPLYANDPHQSAFSNGEQQIENCWIVDMHVQCNPIVTTGQDFFTEVSAPGLYEVDATFPAA